MAPQIACLALNYRATVRIILNLAVAPLIIASIVIGIVVLPSPIISVPFGRGTLRIGVSAPSGCGSLLCQKHLLRSSSFHNEGAFFCGMSHDLADLAELVLRIGSLRVTLCLTFRALEVISLRFFLHILEFLHHSDHVLLKGSDLCTILFIITAIFVRG